jgi:hypothetical protein
MRKREGILAAIVLTACGCLPTESGWPAPSEGRCFACSAKSRIFHRPDCVWIRNEKPAELKWFGTAADAMRAGKIPCEFCKPVE